MNLVRRIGTGLAVTAGLLVLSAVPAEARPLLDSPVYEGPVGVDPMAVWGYVAAAAAVWVVLSGITCIAWAAVGVGLKRRQSPVVRATYPPPVPAVPAVPEPRLWECSDGALRTEAAMAEWLYTADGESAWLSLPPVFHPDDAEISRRFEQIVETERSRGWVA